ncbi:hypothetical protein JHJ32_09120 [Parapedobacter sp. ISTM3]|uniref:Uncharacterized protein n=1 Tax=Parapedobacter luteus TaxID=623280 RepID=A0A1T5A3Z3_9SPHI|nr:MULTISPECIES: hypothetical protein [Parapedobacter]MBK1440144.1 hypothetical protein [Parapedobacter sp. ISTM3]SKB29605.1 hypothetical protein SAMN05660226_00547 [Parapedobacter luteus]
MVRTIIKPTKNSLTIRLPDNLVGKTVEVLAFELETPKVDETVTADKEKRIKALEKGLNKYRMDLSGFKFDRDEANDYD